jgi:hypothetical protein
MLLLTSLLFFPLSVNQVKSACASWRERGGGNGAIWDDCKKRGPLSWNIFLLHTNIITRIDEQRTNMPRKLGRHRAKHKGRLLSLTYSTYVLLFKTSCFYWSRVIHWCQQGLGWPCIFVNLWDPIFIASYCFSESDLTLGHLWVWVRDSLGNES